MTTNSPGSISAPYLPTSVKYPTDPSELQNTLSKSYIEISQAVNRRSIGIFNTFQMVTGNQYFSNTNNSVQKPIQYRQSYRKVFPFSAIAAGATLAIDHAITGITECVNIYGSCITDAIVNPNGKYLPLPYASVTNVNLQIQLDVNDTQINITNGAAADNILSGSIVLEYLLN